MRIHYYGTTIKYTGHYFYEITGDEFRSEKTRFSELDFNPEEYPLKGMKKGDQSIFQTGKRTVLFVSGSPIDKRGGSKSVFWVNELISPEKIREILDGNNIFLEIVNKINLSK
jgi:GH15 family glucan-1,4-alpha-glucosidase